MSTKLDLGEAAVWEHQGGARKSKKRLKLPETTQFKKYSFANKIPHPAELFTFNEYASEFQFPQSSFKPNRISFAEIQDFIFVANQNLQSYWRNGNKLVKLSKIPIYALLFGLIMIVFSFESINLVVFGILIEFFAAIGLYILLYKRLQFEKFILDGEAKINLAELCQEWNSKRFCTKGIKVRPGPLCAWIEFWDYRGQRLHFLEEKMKGQENTNDENEQQKLAREILDEVRKYSMSRVFSNIKLDMIEENEQEYDIPTANQTKRDQSIFQTSANSRQESRRFDNRQHFQFSVSQELIVVHFKSNAEKSFSNKEEWISQELKK